MKPRAWSYWAVAQADWWWPARIFHQGSEFWADLAKQVGRSAAEA